MLELQDLFPQCLLALGILAAAVVLVRLVFSSLRELRKNGGTTTTTSSRTSTRPNQGPDLGARLDAQGARLDAMAVQLDDHRDKLDELGRGQREILEHLTTAKA